MLIGLVIGIACFGALTGARTIVARQRHLDHRATHDSLTGLWNRAGLLDDLSERMTCENDFSVLYLDLDRFKSINDSLGHAAGDEVLRIVGHRIADVIPADCVAARLGGDEFVVVCPSGDSSMSPHRIAEGIAASIVEPVEIDGRLLRIGSSTGIASGPWIDTPAVEILEYANMALHRAKNNGRGRIDEFTNEMRHESDRRTADERELRRAIDAGDIVPFFQPEYDIENGRLVGAEILARWIGPDGAPRSAATILALVDDPSTLEKITSSVVTQSIPIVRRLTAIGLPIDFRFRVNIPQRCTPRAWRDGQIASALRGIDPRRLTIDLHESSRLDDPEGADRVLRTLREAGARVCLEDVAGSPTALGSVPQLPLDELRIDARRLTTPTATAMVRAVTGLAHDLGLVLSATGVETTDHEELLSDLGCHRQQGFLHANVLTADGLEEDLMLDALKRVSAELIA